MLCVGWDDRRRPPNITYSTCSGAAAAAVALAVSTPHACTVHTQLVPHPTMMSRDRADAAVIKREYNARYNSRESRIGCKMSCSNVYVFLIALVSRG
jgi:hypothetical protein